jgi:hypothetical protein
MFVEGARFPNVVIDVARKIETISARKLHRSSSPMVIGPPFAKG